MACKKTPVDLCRVDSRRRWRSLEDPIFRIPGADKRGRLHFFYHCAKSRLPVRDVIAKRKTEPHIEKCAENYCQECMQKNIVGFLKSEEKYLFLFTRCKWRDPRFQNQRFIVGYIRKDRALLCKRHSKLWWCVQGVTKLVSFENAYLLDRYVGGPFYKVIRFKLLNEDQTAKVLEKLGDGRNILGKCKAEIERLVNR